MGRPRQLAVHRMGSRKEKWAQDGAEFTTELVRGDSSRVVVAEPDCSFEFDINHGMSGHWNYGLEALKAHLSQLLSPKGQTILDAWPHVGQWGIRCAKQGASEVVLLEDQ